MIGVAEQLGSDPAAKPLLRRVDAEAAQPASEDMVVFEANDFIRTITDRVLARIGLEMDTTNAGVTRIAAAVRQGIAENYIVGRDSDDQVAGTVSLPRYAIEEGYIPFGIEEAKGVAAHMVEEMLQGGGNVNDQVLLLAGSFGMLKKLSTRDLFSLMMRSNKQRAKKTNIPSEVEVHIREQLLTHQLNDKDLFHSLLSMCIHCDQTDDPEKGLPYKSRMHMTFKDHQDPESLGIKPAKFEELMFKAGHDYYRYSEMLGIETDRDEMKRAFYSRARKNPNVGLKNIAMANYNLIRINKRLGQFEEALACAREVLGIYEAGEVVVPEDYKARLRQTVKNLFRYIRTSQGGSQTPAEA